MLTLGQDLKYGCRMLLKNPGFAAVAVLTLALGIGANTAIFSVINAVLLRPLPYPHADRLVTFWGTNQSMGYSGPGTVCDPDYAEWRKSSDAFEEMAGFRSEAANLTGVGEPARLMGWGTTASFFSLLGVRPALGAAFSPEEEKPGRDHVVLLSYKLWQSRFGAEPAAIGRAIKLDGEFFTVAGVMPADFTFPNRADFWRPAELSADCHNTTLQVVARLTPSATIERARKSMAILARRLDLENHRSSISSTEWQLSPVRLQEEMTANLRPSLLILLGVVGVVLLISCANVANLLLARAAARRREIAIRRALGASRARVILQMLAESLLLAILGGALALVLAPWGRDAVVALIPQNLAQSGFVGRIAAVNLDLWVLSFTLILSLVTGLVFGLAPAFQASKPDLNSSLKEGGRNSTGGVARRGIRSVLVVAEVALALLLLVGAGILVRSFVGLMKVDLGFDPQNVLTMNVELPETRYQTEAQMLTFERQATARIESVAGVRSAGAVFGLPLGEMLIRGNFSVEGQPVPPDLTPSKVVVGGDYFPALGTRLLRGRYFKDGDTADSPRVTILSASLARRFWPGQDPIGRRIRAGFANDPWCSIVGVVADAKQSSPADDTSWAIYLPYAQAPIPFLMRSITFVARSNADALSLAGAARHAVNSVDPELPVYDVATMQELVAQSVSEPRFNTVLLGVFAGLALVLATLGIYGVMSYTVTQRRHEIGVRMALGAERRDVLRLVVGQGLILTSIGVAIGLAGAFGLTRFLAGFLFGVRPTDPITFVTISVLLMAVSAAASYIPARRAMKVDPMVALRYE